MLRGKDVVFQHEQGRNFQIVSLEGMWSSPVVLEIVLLTVENKSKSVHRVYGDDWRVIGWW